MTARARRKPPKHTARTPETTGAPETGAPEYADFDGRAKRLAAMVAAKTAPPSALAAVEEQRAMAAAREGAGQ